MRALTFFQLAAFSAFGVLGSPVLAKPAHKPAAVTAPVSVQAANIDVPGSVRITWQAVPGATEYIVASSRETAANWQSVAVTKSPSYEFVDLPEGTKYYFRVACNTQAGQGPWSAAVTLTTTISKGAVAALQRPLTLTANTQPTSR